jgi:predicted enzyme related to lactoylglutathione lyase
MKAPYAGITFLTYENLEAGDHFYRVVLGLPLIEDQGWARVYRIHGSAHVGIVESRRGQITEPVGSGALISIVVEDVDAWYEHLKDEPSIEIAGPPSMVADIPVYSFFLKDPAGYSIEIQAFTDEAAQQRFGHISAQLLDSPCDCDCGSAGHGCCKEES